MPFKPQVGAKTWIADAAYRDLHCIAYLPACDEPGPYHLFRVAMVGVERAENDLPGAGDEEVDLT